MNNLPKNFCIVPWVMVDCSPFGDFQPCCKINQKFGRSLSEYYKSDELAKLRQQFIDGEKPDICSACWNEEDAGSEKSFRLMLRKRSGLSANFDIESTLPLDLEIPVGNTCNLACNICGSYSSTKWRKEEIEHNKKEQIFAVHKAKNYFDDDEWIEDIKLHSKNLRYIVFHGGEPMYCDMDKHISFLSYINEHSNHAISIKYNTNATIRPPEKLIKIWKKFKQVKILLSIDGLGDHFEYSRWPAKWDVVSKNIDYYLWLRQTLSLDFRCFITFTVSIFTITRIHDVTEWAKRKNIQILYNMLRLSPRNCVKALPTDSKQRVTEFLLSYNNPEYGVVINFMNSEDLSQYFSEFLKILKMTDSYRGLSFATQFPTDAALLGIR